MPEKIEKSSLTRVARERIMRMNWKRIANRADIINRSFTGFTPDLK
jgi:hypothetical protein